MSSSPVEYSIAPSLARDPYRDRRPPYSEDAEIAVLAAMLIDQDAVLRAVETVSDDSFYAEKHRRLFRAMVSIAGRVKVACVASVLEAHVEPTHPESHGLGLFLPATPRRYTGTGWNRRA